jgi:hypothetical protein
MAPHLTAGERAEMIKWQGKGLTPIQICDRLQKARQRRDVGAQISQPSAERSK